jgi:hypothetical protein
MEKKMLNKFNINEDGTPAVELRACIVVYAVSMLGKTPFVARDVEEANHIIVKVREMGCQAYVMDYEVPINYEGWHYPKPLKSLEFSIN